MKKFRRITFILPLRKHLNMKIRRENIKQCSMFPATIVKPSLKKRRSEFVLK